jgi:isoamylase
MKLLPGSPDPLGATWDGDGVNFALYSESADGVELCLFGETGEETRLRLPNRNAFVWHGYAPEVRPGQRYGYRVHGPYDPERGLRFNPEVVLLDPYARAVDGVERWDAGCFSYDLDSPDKDLHPTSSPALGAPRGIVVDPEFDWEDDAPPRTPLHNSVIYEAHVRGLTKLHPEVPEALRGTYAAIAHPAIIRHLRELGVTAVELMPVHAFVDDKLLLDKGLRNYWGYNSIAFFAPDVRYRSAGPAGSEVRELKTAVKALHRAGIEVILDVVYNHTAEGNHLGPTFSFKGIDNATYYRLASDPRYYFDYTGTGNTLNVRHPQVLTLIMDSLRYWAAEVHVDGFRFDLASALARQLHDVDRLSSFFTLIHDSPTLRDVKLIAEPWDVGEGGYQVGNFPVRWAEWNGRYRDAVRALWKGEGGKAGELGYRLSGSGDLYEKSGRRPTASVNFITAHDGFTLRDLVSYDHKHNDANGENNADGNDNEHSWNCGAEGPTDDQGVLALRRRQQRNLLATLLLSQGTPMIVGGDELGRTQRGNNNAYCQDNEISWVDWRVDDEQRSLLEFTRRLLRIRRAHPALRRANFFQGRPIHGTDLRDLAWFRIDGAPMSDEDWSNPSTQSLGMFLAGRGIDDLDEQGRPLVDDNLLLLVNASHVDLTFAMPTLEAVKDDWQLLIDTSDDRSEERVPPSGGTTGLPGRSLKLFRSVSRVIRAGGGLHTLGATYRLQLTPQFGFSQAREQLDYLARLGITDLYSSPILAAARGSTHGYDVVDHARLNPELGTEEDWRELTDDLQRRNMGLLVDWVPNHMGIAAGENAAWEDVLENGPSSLQSETFDVDWSPAGFDMQNTVLLPVLGDQYGQVLERGELSLVYEDGGFKIAYYQHRFPVGPRTLLPLIGQVASATGLPDEHEAQQELESIRSALDHLPTRAQSEPEHRRERAREKEVIKRRLQRLMADSAEVSRAVSQSLTRINGTAGAPTSFDELDRLLRDQGYRLASWRVAAEEINYRRFFDVNSLAAIRMEDPQVFERAHRLIFSLVDQGRIKALRLDHTDGLYDPLGYLDKVQRRFRGDVTDPTLNPDDAARPLPLLVEKILETGERLPSDWPIDGTTGYDFVASVGGLWVDPAAEDALTTFHHRFTGDRRSFADHAYHCKHRILEDSLASEVNMLARQLQRIAAANRRWRDFTLVALTRALADTLAAFPVYRTYLREGAVPSEEDERHVQHAIRLARRRSPTVDETVFDFLRDMLLLRADGSEDERRTHVAFALRFQQLTGPVMAKAVEDTTFYRYNRLLSRNEVGSDPGHFAVSVEAFHTENLERQRTWPLAMVATSTHDTKRGEDASAAISVLSEIPFEWQRSVSRWSQLAARLKPSVDNLPAPRRRDEYTLYQALVGAWPFGWDGKDGRPAFTERISAYLGKAIKEAKEDSSWTRPHPEYEEAVASFVGKLLSHDDFMSEMAAFSGRICLHAACNALSQTLLRLTVPGIPDTYQGSELWNQSLVDPDNRRPVDFAFRRRTLGHIEERLGDPGALACDLLARWHDGTVKLYVIRMALAIRSQHRELFLRGDYDPINGGDHLVGLSRSNPTQRVVVLVPRLTVGLGEGQPSWPLGPVWRDQTVDLRRGSYRNVFTGERHEVTGPVALATIFATFPVALLVRD